MGIDPGVRHWDEAAIWTTSRLRREAWFVPSDGDRLFASLYAAPAPRVPLGVVICPSWGWEMAQQLALCHELAHTLARRGGAAIFYHPPGHGDSTGNPGELTMPRLVRAAVDVQRFARGRMPDLDWCPAGVRLGGAIAACAAPESNVPCLGLVQPHLDPPSYFEELAAAGRRGRWGLATADGAVFGHPLTEMTRWSASAIDPVGALRRFQGRAFAVRCDTPPEPPLPPTVAATTVRGRWGLHVGRRERRALVAAAVAGLSEATSSR